MLNDLLTHCHSDTDLSFCLLKPESYWFGQQAAIERRIVASGLSIVARYQVKVSFNDILTMYRGRMARITMTLRMPHLRYLDMYVVQGDDAITRMDALKLQIRNDMLGLRLGGFIHAPDCLEEFNAHIDILAKAKIKTA